MTVEESLDGIQIYGPETVPRTDELPVGELTSRLVEQVGRLIREELALARVEATARAKRIGLGVGMFGGAGLLAFFGTASLIAAAGIGLANVARPWLAAIVLGAGCFVLAGLVALPGKKGFTAKHPAVPQDTLESLKADAAVVRKAVQHRG
jgi:hypothetical protein